MKKILITYGHLVKHGGAARVIDAIISHSSLHKHLEILCIRNNLIDSDKVTIHESFIKTDNSPLALLENSYFSSQINNLAKSQNYIVHSFGVYGIKPTFYSAQFCVKECFEVLRRHYNENIIKEFYPGFKEMIKVEERMLEGLNENNLISIGKKLSNDLSRQYDLDPSKINIINNASRISCNQLGTDSIKRGNRNFNIGFIGKELLRKGFYILKQALQIIVQITMKVTT